MPMNWVSRSGMPSSGAFPRPTYWCTRIRCTKPQLHKRQRPTESAVGAGVRKVSGWDTACPPCLVGWGGRVTNRSDGIVRRRAARVERLCGLAGQGLKLVIMVTPQPHHFLPFIAYSMHYCATISRYMTKQSNKSERDHA